MKDKELRHLSRSELLEMLLAQVDENKKLKMQLNEMQAQLDNRQIMMNEAGSIAEAALQLNGVFEAAQNAAAQYLENIRRFSGEGDAICQRMEGRGQEKAEAIRTEADAYSHQVCSQADQYQRQVVKKTQDLLREQDGLHSQFCSLGEEQKT